MTCGVYTAAGKNAVISDKEQMSLHDSLLGGMCTEAHNKVLQNLNLDLTQFPDGLATRFKHEHLYIAHEAQM